MKITLKTPKIDDYLGKTSVGHSLASQEIFMIEALNRVLVGAYGQHKDLVHPFMDYVFDEALKPASTEYEAKPFDKATLKAWNQCYGASHPVLGLALLRQARMERVLIDSAQAAIVSRDFREAVEEKIRSFTSDNLSIGTAIGGKMIESTVVSLFQTSGEQLLNQSMDAYGYHIEGLHVPYAVEAEMLYVGQLLIAQGYVMRDIQKMVSNLAMKTPFLNVGQHIDHVVEMDSFQHLIKQFQLACIWLTCFKDGQQGMSEVEAAHAYNTIVFRGMSDYKKKKRG